MRLFLALPVFLLLLCGPLPADEDEREVALELPPASLGQWYRPVAKRDAWLHTMFALRREMQAVTEYAALGDRQRLMQWLDRLEKDYRSIGEMVPEWKDELELELFPKMRAAKSPEELGRLQRKLAMSCQGCHREYKLAAVLRYRTPDFDRVKVESSETLEEEDYSRVMQRLTMLVNRIKIASVDERWPAARDALEALKVRLEDLGESCGACHKESAPRERILGAAAEVPLEHVAKGLAAQDARTTGRFLGEFAVNACARCHAIHRPLANLRRLLEKAQQEP